MFWRRGSKRSCAFYSFSSSIMSSLLLRSTESALHFKMFSIDFHIYNVLLNYSHLFCIVLLCCYWDFVFLSLVSCFAMAYLGWITKLTQTITLSLSHTVWEITHTHTHTVQLLTCSLERVSGRRCDRCVPLISKATWRRQMIGEVSSLCLSVLFFLCSQSIFVLFLSKIKCFVVPLHAVLVSLLKHK